MLGNGINFCSKKETGCSGETPKYCEVRGTDRAICCRKGEICGKQKIGGLLGRYLPICIKTEECSPDEFDCLELLANHGIIKEQKDIGGYKDGKLCCKRAYEGCTGDDNYYWCSAVSCPQGKKLCNSQFPIGGIKNICCDEKEICFNHPNGMPLCLKPALSPSPTPRPQVSPSPSPR